MHELVTVDFRNVDRHLGLGRPEGCKGKDRYQGAADALPWHKILPSRNRNFRKRPVDSADSVNRLKDYVLVSIQRPNKKEAPAAAGARLGFVVTRSPVTIGR